MADPIGKAGRVARSRAACGGCRQMKQKCDGPSRIPCRRCELYGLECEYPPSSGPSTSSYGANKTPQGTSTSLSPLLRSPALTTSLANDPKLSEKLREIADRLRSIEQSLDHVHLSPLSAAASNGGRHNRHSTSVDGGNGSGRVSGGSIAGSGGGPDAMNLNGFQSPSSVPSLAHHHSSEADSSASPSLHENDTGRLAPQVRNPHDDSASTEKQQAKMNPMQTVSQTVDMVEAMAKEGLVSVRQSTGTLLSRSAIGGISDLSEPDFLTSQSANRTTFNHDNKINPDQQSGLWRTSAREDQADRKNDSVEHGYPKPAPTPSVNPRAQRLFGNMVKPDVIVRGIMNMSECEASCHFFFSRIAPWLSFFECEKDHDVATLRERSPILFHVVLLTASYYLMEASERGEQIYYVLTALVNEIMAPLLISPLPHQINSDFVRAVCILLLHKPVQYANLYSEGVSEPDIAEQMSKMNRHASSILSGLLIRTANSIGLPNVTAHFAKSFSSNTQPDPEMVADLRLWYWLLCVDTHSATTMGRAGQTDISEAVRTTRLFAALRLQPSDIRLAALVEIYAIAKGVLNSPWYQSAGHKRVPVHELKRFNKEMDDFEEYWTDPLKEAAQNGDDLAITALVVYSDFIRVVVNSVVFMRWQVDRKEMASRGKIGRPEVSRDDWNLIQVLVDAAERLLYSLSVESRAGWSRTVNWPRKAGGPRPLLHLDSRVVETHRMAFDNIITVIYLYTTILLVKIANCGLIRCDLMTYADVYDTSTPCPPPQAMVNGAKLGALVTLCACFLEEISPSLCHPAKKQAKVLRSLFAAGTYGQSGPTNPVYYQETLAAANAAVAAAGANAMATSGSTFDPHTSSPNLPALSSSRQTNPKSLTSDPAHGYPNNHGNSGYVVNSLVSAPPGQVLESLLDGLHPDMFESTNFYENMLGGRLNDLDSMKVDWDTLEKSMNSISSSQAHASGVGGDGVFNGGNDPNRTPILDQQAPHHTHPYEQHQLQQHPQSSQRERSQQDREHPDYYHVHHQQLQQRPQHQSHSYVHHNASQYSQSRHH